MSRETDYGDKLYREALQDCAAGRLTCDGKTFMGFTTEKCGRPATIVKRNGTFEIYAFCSHHAFFYNYGYMPGDEKKGKP